MENLGRTPNAGATQRGGKTSRGWPLGTIKNVFGDPPKAVSEGVTREILEVCKGLYKRNGSGGGGTF